MVQFYHTFKTSARPGFERSLVASFGLHAVAVGSVYDFTASRLTSDRM